MRAVATVTITLHCTGTTEQRAAMVEKVASDIVGDSLLREVYTVTSKRLGSVAISCPLSHAAELAAYLETFYPADALRQET